MSREGKPFSESFHQLALAKKQTVVLGSLSWNVYLEGQSIHHSNMHHLTKQRGYQSVTQTILPCIPIQYLESTLSCATERALTNAPQLFSHSQLSWLTYFTHFVDTVTAFFICLHLPLKAFAAYVWYPSTLPGQLWSGNKNSTDSRVHWYIPVNLSIWKAKPRSVLQGPGQPGQHTKFQASWAYIVWWVVLVINLTI